MEKILIIIWIVGCCGEFLVPFILSSRIKNYSHLRTVMSAIGSKENGIVGILYSVWLILFGVIVVCISYSIRDFSSIGTYKAAIIILGVYGIGCVICGIFPVNNTKEMITVSAKIHGYVAAITFLMLMFVPLLLKKALYANGINGLAIGSNFVFVGSLVLFVLQILSEREQFVGTILGNTGLWQRLYLGVIYVYISFVLYNISTNI
ncbi:DUF998 domain-containing protein [Vallitalea guaymasensis]|uniref:DUF998 domain-containing protein n=1 Tax=Vallitalea guaymasensis TaxID=1185412 RepID=UPI00272B0684|nr:DUF998 domain-containing protein [Vallitalea guaymasensis]